MLAASHRQTRQNKSRGHDSFHNSPSVRQHLDGRRIRSRENQKNLSTFFRNCPRITRITRMRRIEFTDLISLKFPTYSRQFASLAGMPSFLRNRLVEVQQHPRDDGVSSELG